MSTRKRPPDLSLAELGFYYNYYFISFLYFHLRAEWRGGEGAEGWVSGMGPDYTAVRNQVFIA